MVSRPLLLAVALSASIVVGAYAWSQRCVHCPADPGELLVAHAGGGYPSGIYANDEASLDAAKANGFKLIELDFAQEGDTLVLQHDLSKPVAMSLDDLIRWLDRNPGPKIITDIKSDNLAGLAILKAAAGDHLERFIPQIYSLDEYTPVIAMGFQAPIFTVYRIRPGEEPVAEANKLPLRAVTMPAERYQLADRVTHPVYLHTLNERVPGFGLYTDFLIPD
jgi:hypothetical protein